MAVNESLEDYENYFARLRAFQMICERDEYKITARTSMLFDNGGLFFTVLEEKGRAIQEINKLVIQVPNTNVERVIRKIRSDCEEISNGFDLINSKVRLFVDTKESGDNKFQIQLKKFSDNERTFYYGFASLTASFYDFYKWFIETIELPETSENNKKEVKDKLTHKQQILLLHSIGFFDLEIFSTLSTKQKGVLVSHILNRTEKDSEDLIRYFRGKKTEDKFETKTTTNIKVVKELLKKINREDIKV